MSQVVPRSIWIWNVVFTVVLYSYQLEGSFDLRSFFHIYVQMPIR